MQFQLVKTLKDLLEGNHTSAPEAPWERDYKLTSSLHVELPPDREERICSLFLRMSSLFESGILFQANRKAWKPLLSFHRGEIKTPPQEDFILENFEQPLFQIHKTENDKWKKLFASHYKGDLTNVSVYRIRLSPNTVVLIADTLPDPWMKMLLPSVHERIMRGIA